LAWAWGSIAYGWEAAHSPAYRGQRGRSWQEVEPELRCGWESQNTRSTWDEVQNQVRDAWDVALEARPAERSSEPAEPAAAPVR